MSTKQTTIIASAVALTVCDSLAILHHAHGGLVQHRGRNHDDHSRHRNQLLSVCVHGATTETVLPVGAWVLTKLGWRSPKHSKPLNERNGLLLPVDTQLP